MAASESYKGKDFKFETEHHLFFLRCIPRPGDYDCYCCAYSKAALEQVLSEQEQDETQMIGGISQ